MTQPIKPVLRYHGAKWRIASWVIENLPPHKHYLEPFFGSGAVFFCKEPAPIETINDIDGRVVNFFRVLRERPDELIQALALTPWSRRECEEGGEPSSDPLEDARRFAVRCWQARASRIIGSSGWQHRIAGGYPDVALWAKLPDRLRAVTARLARAQIECRPAVDVIAQYNHRDVLIYADPPYLLGLRGRAYTHEMTDEDHVRLLEVLMQHKGPVVLSGYRSELYMDTLKGWQHKTRETIALMGARRTEVLWLNPLAVKMLEARKSTLAT